MSENYIVFCFNNETYFYSIYNIAVVNMTLSRYVFVFNAFKVCLQAKFCFVQTEGSYDRFLMNNLHTLDRKAFAKRTYY